MELIATDQAASWETYLRSSGADEGQQRLEFRRQLERLHPDYPAIGFPPFLFNQGMLEQAAQAGLELLELLFSLPDRIFGGDVTKLLEFQGFSASQIDFIRSMYSPRSVEMAKCFARPDLLVTAQGLKAIEMNVSSSMGGLGIIDRIESEMQVTPYFDFVRRQGFELRGVSTMDVWLEAMDTLRRVPVTPGRRPVFLEALVTPSEFENPCAYHEDILEPIRQHGFDVLTGLLQELQFSDDGVYLHGKRIDVVYVMFTYSEVVDLRLPRSLFEALMAADAARLVDFIAPPIGTVFDNKANFELLTSPDYAACWTAEEQAFIRRHLPSTRRLSPSRRKEAEQAKDELVLKATNEFGGRSVFIGSELSPQEWKNTLDEAFCVFQRSRTVISV